MTNDGSSTTPTPSRRDFLHAAGAVAAAAATSGLPADAAPSARKVRYAIVGPGHRGSGMWGAETLKRHGGTLDLVALCDVNPKRAEAANGLMGTKAPVYADLDRMLAEARPERVAVTTVAILEAEKRTGRKVAMAFNYRYSPKNELIWQLLRTSGLGNVTSIDFSWYLDVFHGADYFRRWHRLKSKGGSLWVHKSTHHFDLVNWWLGADPVEVSASSSLRRYGRNGAVRGTHCRACLHKGTCEFFFDLTANPRLMALYAGPAGEDGYLRDGCVFREDCDIWDTMNAVVSYSDGVQMSYSVNAFMPFEGFRLAFNCEKGRIEVRDWERQGWEVPYETEVLVARSFDGGHSGGDPRLLDAVFGKDPVPEQLRVPDSRAGAMSCLTGIAARTSSETGTRVKIADLAKAAGLGG